LECPLEEIFYGGARGGGKTDGCLGEWLKHQQAYGQHARGIFVRRIAEDLSDVILRSQELFLPLGAKWNANSRTWVFPNGAILRFRHLKDQAAAAHYQGHAYTRIYFEELVQWPTPDAYNLMRGALRSVHGVACKMISTGNPGGPGHFWVKARFYDPAPQGFTPIKDERSGVWYTFIPAKLEDNPLLQGNDPAYERRLLASGNAELVKAWRWGEWEIVAGSYFSDVWNPERQQLPVFPIPHSWTLRRSFDWGSAVPSSLGLWAISSGEPIREGELKDMVFTPGSLIRIGEWYTAEVDEAGRVVPNKGLRLANEQLGAGVGKISLATLGRHNLGGFHGCVADGAIFARDGGESIYQQMRGGAAQVGHDLVFRAADKERVAGWQKVYTMLSESAKPIPDGPGMYYWRSCAQFKRTMPLLQMDERRPEDVDTRNEDHVGDETRYAAQTVNQAAGGGFWVVN
jgi:hypothetical protein